MSIITNKWWLFLTISLALGVWLLTVVLSSMQRERLRQSLSRESGFEIPRDYIILWGSKNMAIDDPFGNKITFTNAIST
jgi:hypothetical protein